MTASSPIRSHHSVSDAWADSRVNIVPNRLP